MIGAKMTFRTLGLASVLIVVANLPLTCGAQQHFTDVTEAVGIVGQTGFGHAVAWCDIDRDRDPDLIFSNQDGTGLWLYRNDGGAFTDITDDAGLAGARAFKILCAELSGDRYVDLVLSRSSTSVYLNQGDSTFARQPSQEVLGDRTRCIADFDNDGMADLLVWADPGLGILQNQGGGVFAAPVQIAEVPDCWTTVCFDSDLDGLMDIYVGTYGEGSNQLFRNQGDLAFTEEAESAGLAWTGRTHGLDVGDYDSDGLPDLYLGSYSAPGCKLYRNLGNGSFADVTAAAGVVGHSDTRTVSFADFDSDGFLDIFVSHHDFYNYSNSMWHNNGDGTFTDVGDALGLSGGWIGDYFGVGL